jgi:pyruvate dehydrogenase complex dehydrogenase (E1) component
VDWRHIVVATLSGLMREGSVGADEVSKAIAELEINPDKPDPFAA